MSKQLALALNTRPTAAVYDQLLPDERQLSSGSPPVFEWNIGQTISELAYLTHNFYRYYGKFPSTIPRKLLRDFRPADGTWVLDNFAGSGTTLVEAKLAGIPSIGLDQSPLAALASRVKSQHHDLERLETYRRRILTALRARRQDAQISRTPSREFEASDFDKWFTREAQQGLACLKEVLLTLPRNREREFLLLAFLAIIRRTSRAYDGEVRPHINPAKPERGVIEAFERKTIDMMKRAREYQAVTDASVDALAFTCDARTVSATLAVPRKPIGLIISHPPYLNCFDYVPVYRLEYMWAHEIPELGEWQYSLLRKSELRSWPATDEVLVDRYFDGLRLAFEEAADMCVKKARCCIVLGDCTVHGRVVPVIQRLIATMEAIGFVTERIIYRTTHYGTGKYAYAARADYHGDGAAKKDGITVFRKK